MQQIMMSTHGRPQMLTGKCTVLRLRYSMHWSAACSNTWQRSMMMAMHNPANNLTAQATKPLFCQYSTIPCFSGSHPMLTMPNIYRVTLESILKEGTHLLAGCLTVEVFAVDIV
jgi:hypothetical protein